MIRQDFRVYFNTQMSSTKISHTLINKRDKYINNQIRLHSKISLFLVHYRVCGLDLD